MKKIFLILCVLTTPLFAQQVASIHATSSTLVPPAFSWTMTVHDFGKIPLNKPVTHEFRFTNTGNSPLIISSVQASCGCTVTDYSKDPIAPRAEGFVKATYNAAKAGIFTKTVTVNANSEESVVRLMIKGEVE
jgi:hypothetical protein